MNTEKNFGKNLAGKKCWQAFRNENHPCDHCTNDRAIKWRDGRLVRLQVATDITAQKKLDPEVRAIVSSGYSTDPILSNFRDHGFLGAVVKPYRLKDLSTVLHDVLEGQTRYS